MCTCDDPNKSFNYVQLDNILAKHRHATGKVIKVLQETQDIFGYIPEDAIRQIAHEFQVPSSEIYGVATFYGQFYLHSRGQNIIRVCTGTACHVRGSGKVLEAINKTLGLQGNEVTTADMLFTVEPVACLGACGMAPVIMINEDAYGRVTPEEVPAIIAHYQKEGERKICTA